MEVPVTCDAFVLGAGFVNDGRKRTPWRRVKTDPFACHWSSVVAAGTRPRSRLRSR
jgi:hypothetical protein